jgi:hypothetical protein
VEAALTRTGTTRPARAARLVDAGGRGSWTARVTSPDRTAADRQGNDRWSAGRWSAGGQTRSVIASVRSRRRAEAMGDLHVADSRGALAYLREPPGFAPRYLAGILTAAMCRAAGLDDAEAADLLERYWPLPGRLEAADLDRARGLADLLSLYLRTPTGDLLDSDATIRWTADLTAAAARLRAVAYEGFVATRRLPTPEFLWQDLAHAIGAHWNRLGLSAGEQIVLAVALRNTLWRTRRNR